MRGHVEHSPLKLAKARTLFSVYDNDGNGFIERADFEAVADNFVQIRSLTSDSEQSQRLRHLYLNIWEELQSVADEDGDGRVSFPEMLSYLDKLTHDPCLFHQQVVTLSELLFRLLDVDGDGSIAYSEYQEFAECLRFETSEENFSRLSQGAASLSAAQLSKRLQEFYYSENPSSAGNVLFGNLVGDL